MGNGNYIICQKCEYEREFLLGSGMMRGNIENIIGFMDKRSREEASLIMLWFQEAAIILKICLSNTLL